MSAAPPPLLSVVYTSFSAHPLDAAELRELLDQSRNNNGRRDVTGMLLYRGGRFLQILEGPAETVRELVTTIGSDARHTGMRVMFEETVTQRQFADWTMGHESITEPTIEAPAGFRSTFRDLDDATDLSSTMRAVRELSLWFRVRARPDAAPSTR